MAHERAATVLCHLRRLIGVETAREATDAQLLRQFAVAGDEGAFAALLQRHGRLVWGLCRRALSHHDAEDAFQATFLVLARKAASIRKEESLASWLYGVAYRIAARVRENAARRCAMEGKAQGTAPAQPPTEAGLRELQAALEEEVERLPDIYRAPFVLCCLAGKSKAEAATELGWKEGTLSGRLARARERLRQRLARRGVALSAVLTAVALAQPAVAVPVPLMSATLGAARSFAGASTAAVLSPRALGLAHGFLASLTAVRMTLGNVLLLLCGLVVAGAGLAASQAGKAEPAGMPPAAQGVNPSPAGNDPPRTDLYGDPLPPGAVVRLGSTSLRHGSTVYAVALAPDGKTVASAAGDGRICLWDTVGGKLLHEWRPAVQVLAIAFAPDGKTLASGDKDAAVTLWEVTTGKPRRRLAGHAERVTAVAYSPDGAVLASASADGVIHLWQPATGAELRRLQGHGPSPSQVKGTPNPGRLFPLVGCLAFAPDGKTLASGGADGTARLWDVAAGKEIRRVKGHTQNAHRPGFMPLGATVSGVAFAHDGKTLATASYDDSTVLLWDVATGERRGQLAGHTHGVHTVAYSPAGKTLATGGAFYDGSVRLWDAASGKQLAKMAGHTHSVYALDFSKDGRLVASGGADGAVRLWDAATGRETPPWRGHHEQVNAIGYSPDGKTIATASHDKTIRLWAVATGKEIRRLEGHRQWVNAVAFSPDGKLLASASYDGDGAVRFWDPATGREIRRVPLQAGALALAFSPDGRRIAVRDNSYVLHLLETATGVTVRRIELPRGSAYCVAFSPDGKHLAADSGYGLSTVHLLEAATGKEVYRLTGPKADPLRVGSLVFSPDGKTLASAGWDRKVRLWEVASGLERYQTGVQEDAVQQVAFSADGRRLVSGGKDRTVRLFDALTGQERDRFLGHPGAVRAVAIAPDGRTVASGGDDTTVLVWRVPAAKVARAKWSAAVAEALWADLAAVDGAHAYRAVGQLVAASREVAPLLRRRLEEAVKPDPAPAQWLADLDSKQFAVRDRAAQALEKMGARAEAALRRALAGNPSLEVRQRLERLLQKLAGPVLAPETLRLLRAVEALEHIGTAEARAALRALAVGAAGCRPGREASAALERLRKRPERR